MPPLHMARPPPQLSGGPHPDAPPSCGSQGLVPGLFCHQALEPLGLLPRGAGPGVGAGSNSEGASAPASMSPRSWANGDGTVGGRLCLFGKMWPVIRTTDRSQDTPCPLDPAAPETSSQAPSSSQEPVSSQGLVHGQERDSRVWGRHLWARHTWALLSWSNHLLLRGAFLVQALGCRDKGLSACPFPRGWQEPSAHLSTH